MAVAGWRWLLPPFRFRRSMAAGHEKREGVLLTEAVRFHRKGAAWAVLAGVLCATPAAAEMCARDGDMPALQTRVLQTDLMVAALTCDERARYNAFVGKHRAELVVRGHELKGLFNRAYGPRALANLDSFVTRLANEASLNTVAARTSYCTDAVATFTAVLKETPRGALGAMAAGYARAAAHGIRACNTPAQQADAGN